VQIELTIDPDATPGERELRLRTPQGLTNPLRFQVGLLPEVCEQEPNDPETYFRLPKPAPLELPAVLNGQITPGDVDRFSFRARQGQQLVMQVQARSLVPYLADAVPGWFQATLTLYDRKGKEVAFDDDYRFDPDPVLFYKVPEDGVYQLEIRDAIYRGREDFVYRVAVGELPFITRIFPLGGRAGAKTVIRRTALRLSHSTSNWVRYAVDTLPEGVETEPNDTLSNAEAVAAPRIINGRISKPGDVDVFRFEGRGGDEVVAEGPGMTITKTRRWDYVLITPIPTCARGCQRTASILCSFPTPSTMAVKRTPIACASPLRSRILCCG